MKYIIFTILISILPGIYGQNYYVSSTGNEDNDGSLLSPWLTIQNGIDNLAPGNTLYIMAGTYNEKVFVEASGKPDSIITIKNYNGEVVTISGSGITASEAIIELFNVSNITIEGLNLANNEMLDAKGILIDGNCDNITIKNNTIYNINFSTNAGDAVTESTNAQPLIVFGSDASSPIENLVIVGNEIYNSRTGYSEALAVNGNVDGFKVINNHVHDISNIGIDIIGHEETCSDPANDQARNGVVKNNATYNCISDYATSGGIYVDGGKDLLIENNSSYHNGYGIEIGCENTGKTTSNIVVKNNVFYDNQVCAIAVGGFDYPGGSGKVVNCDILNNSCLKNDFSQKGTGELYLTYLEEGSIMNNIFYLSDQDIFAYAESSQSNLVMDYNLFYSVSGNFDVNWNDTEYESYAAFNSGTGFNTHSVFGDPLLTSASKSSPQFTIHNSSPAIDAGDPSYTAGVDELDIFGESRIINGRIDIGAAENQSGSGIEPVLYHNSSFIYPNPFRDVIHIPADEDIHTQVLTISGSLLMKSTGKEINLEFLPKGIYIVKINTDKGKTIIEKVIKY